ncbi:hypothetical protein [Bradyrhizobium liaoningense]|uniref:hypothetical protein n=1 Tax=Bradyrhizobium liaoningense TaxID=43992 RepID=UPI002899179B|nr:hypothetical protein [Bradyrhizobium liaoningense]
MSIKQSIVVGIVAAVMIGGSHAEPNEVLYRLQERCGKQTSETFQKEWGGNVVNTKDGQTLANFENHYNARLNKCLYLESTTMLHAKEKKANKSLRLFDLHENREIGSFFSLDGRTMMCNVRDASCKTEDEWRALAKPLMEE